MFQEQVPESVQSWEATARGELAPHLNCSLPLLGRIYNLIHRAMNTISNTRADSWSHSLRACVHLLVRITKAARAISLLCETGYSIEAFGSAATIYEASWAIAYIGNDNNYGLGWHLHTNDKRTFGDNLDAIIRGALQRVGRPSAKTDVDAEYEIYRKLCLAKHVNPLIQSYDGYVGDDELILFLPSPGSDVYEVMKSWYVTLNAVRAAQIGVRTFLDEHVEPMHARPLLAELDSIISDVDEQWHYMVNYLDEIEPKITPEYTNKFKAFRKTFEF